MPWEMHVQNCSGSISGRLLEAPVWKCLKWRRKQKLFSSFQTVVVDNIIDLNTRTTKHSTWQHANSGHGTFKGCNPREEAQCVLKLWQVMELQSFCHSRLQTERNTSPKSSKDCANLFSFLFNISCTHGQKTLKLLFYFAQLCSHLVLSSAQSMFFARSKRCCSMTWASMSVALSFWWMDESMS